jgi:hypothetical protein
MGQPGRVHPRSSRPQGRGAIPGELKHLSIRRQEKTKCDSLSSGERNGNSPNAVCVKPECVANRGLRGFGGGEFGPLVE